MLRRSRMLALSVDHLSSSFHIESPGNSAWSFVSQLNEPKPSGSAVTLRPLAKSSMRMPIALARNAFEHEPMPVIIWRTASGKISNTIGRAGMYLWIRRISLFGPIPPGAILGDHRASSQADYTDGHPRNEEGFGQEALSEGRNFGSNRGGASRGQFSISELQEARRSERRGESKNNGGRAPEQPHVREREDVKNVSEE